MSTSFRIFDNCGNEFGFNKGDLFDRVEKFFEDFWFKDKACHEYRYQDCPYCRDCRESQIAIHSSSGKSNEYVLMHIKKEKMHNLCSVYGRFKMAKAAFAELSIGVDGPDRFQDSGCKLSEVKKAYEVEFIDYLSSIIGKSGKLRGPLLRCI